MASAAPILPNLLVSAVERFGDRPALVMDGQTLTFAGLDDASSRMARSLLRYGIRRGERVAIWMPMSLEAFVAIWGVLKAGAAYVPLDHSAPPLRAAAIANNCDAAGLVTTMERAAGFCADTTAGTVRSIWCADLAGEPPTGPAPQVAKIPMVEWRELESERAEPPSVDIEADNLAAIIHTSGSSGTPKGVMMTHRAMHWDRERKSRYGVTSADRVPAFTPIHSTGASPYIFSNLTAGATTYPVPPRIAAFPAAVAKSWSEQKLTVWSVISSVLVLMLKHGNLESLDLSSLRMIKFAGETLPIDRLRELMELLPHVCFIHGYSRTESRVRCAHEVKFPPKDIDTRIIGEPSPDCHLHVLDENEAPVIGSAPGELWVSSPGLMSGYWGLPELTAQVLKKIDAGGGTHVLACRTGDLVRRLESGRLEFLGRADHQVKVRGFRVELGEIEACLARHTGVAQAAVVALPHDTFGSRLMAAVVLKAGAVADEDTLKRHCAAALPPHMVPETVDIRANLPLLSGGKVDRRALLAESEGAEDTRSSK
ncbi:MAG TPA: amino acid adenylation domain-containing protein [Candidatus Binataceae bacterium]|nr:amino acid adenylation domain-containing protein [Candidatus Binataceae bacterium]